MPGNLQSCVFVSSSVASLSQSLTLRNINLTNHQRAATVYTSCEADEDQGRDGPAVTKSCI